MKITIDIPDDTVRVICATIGAKDKKRTIINKQDLKDGGVYNYKTGKAIEKRPYIRRNEETR